MSSSEMVEIAVITRRVVIPGGEFQRPMTVVSPQRLDELINLGLQSGEYLKLQADRSLLIERTVSGTLFSPPLNPFKDTHVCRMAKQVCEGSMHFWYASLVDHEQVGDSLRVAESRSQLHQYIIYDFNDLTMV